MSNVPESIETMIEALRREAAALDDYRLDQRIRETVGRRDVAAAHGREHVARCYNDILIALDASRVMRSEVSREIEQLTSPPGPVQPMAIIDESDDDETTEPPC